MYVVKRDGTREPVSFDKITERLRQLCALPPAISSANVDATAVAQEVVAGICPGITTAQLDTLASETAAYMSTVHPDYGTLAARIAVSNHHKQTSPNFVDAMRQAYEYRTRQTHELAPMLDAEFMACVERNGAAIELAIRHERDYMFEYFGFKTLRHKYLLETEDEQPIERPQYLFMRVALWLHGDDLPAVFETYTLLSTHVMMHATPTLFNAGTERSQCSSCFLLRMQEVRRMRT